MISFERHAWRTERPVNRMECQCKVIICRGNSGLIKQLYATSCVFSTQNWLLFVWFCLVQFFQLIPTVKQNLLKL